MRQALGDNAQLGEKRKGTGGLYRDGDGGGVGRRLSSASPCASSASPSNSETRPGSLSSTGL